MRNKENRTISEVSYSTREALTIAIENCEDNMAIKDIINILKNKNTIENEERFHYISDFIKENVYGAEWCYHCRRWFFDDDYDVDIPYDNDKESCLFCILSGDSADSGIDFTI